MRFIRMSQYDMWVGKRITISVKLRDNNEQPSNLRLRNAAKTVNIHDVLFTIRYGLKVVRPFAPYGMGIGFRRS